MLAGSVPIASCKWILPRRNSIGFDAILQRFELPLLRYATRIIGDQERARDVVQETFVQLQRSKREEHDNAPAQMAFHGLPQSRPQCVSKGAPHGFSRRAMVASADRAGALA